MTALLRLRLTVLRRRYGSPLEGFVLLGLCGLAWVGGGAAAGRKLPPEWAGVAFSLGWLGLAVAFGFLGRRQLYTARELALLLPAGVSSGALVTARGVEATLFALAASAPGVSCAAGYASALELGLAGPATVAWWVIASLALAALSLLVAWGVAGGPLTQALTLAAVGGAGWAACVGLGAGS
ncbi:MAG: hypothetical protein KDD82_13425, partial [Planctomycetes bacterium]|nr:hypothetical protein [Planctomycetota bacterium]